MVSNSASRLLSLASLLAFLACLLFAVLSVFDGMNDPRLLLATLACLGWSYVASVWSENQVSVAREPLRAKGLARHR